MKRVPNHINYELIILILLSLYMGIIYFSIALSNIFMGMAIFVFLLGWFKKKIYLNFQKKNVRLFFVLIIPFVLTVFSAFFSEDFSQGLKLVHLRAPIFLIPLILIFTEIKNKNIKIAAFLFAILSSVAVIFTLFKASKYFGEGIILQPDFTYFITPIQHPYFGIYLLIALILAIELKFFSNKIFKLFILSILITGIIISTSRLVYTLLFLTISFYSIHYLKRKKSLLVISILIIFSGTFISFNKSIQTKFKTSFSYQSSPRLKLWNNALKVINNSENKLLGIGVGDYYSFKRDPYFFKESETGLYGYDPHSQLFDFFISNGYIGLFILIGYFLIQLVWASKQKRLAIFIFTIISIFALTESILNRQYGVQLYSTILPFVFKSNLKRLS